MIRSFVAVAAVAATATVPAHAGGRVALTFDDGWQSVITEVLPIIEKYNLRATAFITPGLFCEPHYICAHQISQLVDSGWEIGAHSLFHDDLITLTATQVANEMLLPKLILQQLTGQQIVSVASPYGSYDQIVLDAAAKQYSYHVNAWSNAEGINDRSVDPYDIHRWTIRNTDSAEQVCDRIRSLTNEQSFVIAFHDVVDGAPREYDVTPQTVKRIAQCVAEYSESITVQEIVK